jgi:hypothetical protein
MKEVLAGLSTSSQMIGYLCLVSDSWASLRLLNNNSSFRVEKLKFRESLVLIENCKTKCDFETQLSYTINLPYSCDDSYLASQQVYEKVT